MGFILFVCNFVFYRSFPMSDECWVHLFGYNFFFKPQYLGNDTCAPAYSIYIFDMLERHRQLSAICTTSSTMCLMHIRYAPASIAASANNKVKLYARLSQWYGLRRRRCNAHTYIGCKFKHTRCIAYYTRREWVTCDANTAITRVEYTMFYVTWLDQSAAPQSTRTIYTKLV